MIASRAAPTAARRTRGGAAMIQNVVVIPVLWRNGVSASSVALRGMELSGGDSTLRRLSHWYKQG